MARLRAATDDIYVVSFDRTARDTRATRVRLHHRASRSVNVLLTPDVPRDGRHHPAGVPSPLSTPGVLPEMREDSHGNSSMRLAARPVRPRLGVVCLGSPARAISRPMAAPLRV